MNRREKYSEYLLGEHWKALKVSIYRSRGRKCEVCAAVDRIQGHHLTYRPNLESCTEEDIMLLCSRCHELVHRDAELDSFFRGAADNATKRRAVIEHLTKAMGGVKRLNKLRCIREEGYTKQRQQLDYRPPLREARPRKKWLDYAPEKFPEPSSSWCS